MSNQMSPRQQAIHDEVWALNLDQVVSKISCFETFEALLRSGNTGYRPSLYTKPKGRSNVSIKLAAMALRVANAYDYEMAKRGCHILAFRGNDEQPKRAPEFDPEVRTTVRRSRFERVLCAQ